ncbi:HAD family hydrolase [Candidatus Woesearchaeota archaeon]|nr:HAD family hydrolase [Candidatus Woesearchaeota archaeon]
MRKKEVKAVLFDLDGVLVDSLDAWFNVFNDSLKHFGFKKLTKKQFTKDFGAPIEYDVKKHFIGKTIREVEPQYNENFKRRKNLVKLFPQAIKVLRKLKQGKLKTALLSNSTRFIVNTILNHYKLKKYFDVIVTMDDVKRRKPAPDMILKACKKLKVKPQNTILIGDTKNDMVAGKRAGCVTVGYKVKGDYRVDALREIERFI